MNETQNEKIHCDSLPLLLVKFVASPIQCSAHV